MASKKHTLWAFARGANRDAELPRYRAFAPGLIVTQKDVWAWYEVPPTNSDLLDSDGRQREQDSVERTLKAFDGHELHLRVMWGQIDGSRYLGDIGVTPEHRDGVRRWAELRAASIDARGLPERVVLLGVKLGSRKERSPDFLRNLGISDPSISERELNEWSAKAVRLGQKVGAPSRDGDRFGVRLASVERIVWMTTKDTHRGALPRSGEEVVTGASIASITASHIQPYSDHLVFLDGQDKPTSYAAVLGLTGFPEVMTEGQEWAACLSGVMFDGDYGSEPVDAEMSCRITAFSSRAARDLTAQVRKDAKEQRRAAESGVAGEPPEHIQEALEETEAVASDIKSGRAGLISDHPRIIVTARTRDELDRKIDAVQATYDDLGIDAVTLLDEQREAWIEAMPCDQVRIPDLGHIRDRTSFVQSWFWGGAAAGSRSSEASSIGFTTGTTTQVVRADLAEMIDLAAPPLVVFSGVTRYGKTTSMLMMLFDLLLHPRTQDRNPWSVVVDFKGDLGGVELACREFGIPCSVVTLDPSDAGALCGFRTAPADIAIDEVTAQLTSLLEPEEARVCAGTIGRAVTKVWGEHGDDARCWKVVDELREQADEQGARHSDALRVAADALHAAQQHGLGRLIVGKPEAERELLPRSSGLIIVSVPSAVLPSKGDSPSEWTTPQRVSVSVLRGLLSWIGSTVSAKEMRGAYKAVAFPEVHLLTATREGQAALSRAGRMWAAWGVSLLLDTQDGTGFVENDLAEAIGMIAAFTQQTRREQEVVAGLLRLPVNDSICDVIAGLGDSDAVDDVGNSLRRGHCILRDVHMKAATVQWDIPPEVLRILDTSSKASAARFSEPEQEVVLPERNTPLTPAGASL